MTEEQNSDAEKEMSKEEKEDLDMELGKKGEPLETEAGRESRLEHDSITPAEEGFMRGEEKAGDLEPKKEEEKKEEKEEESKEEKKEEEKKEEIKEEKKEE